MNREVAQEQMLRDVFRLLNRQRVVIVITTLVALGAAIGYSILKSPVYQATADLQFVDQQQDLSELGLPVGFNGQDPAKQVAQDAEKVTSAEVVQGVANDVDTDLSSSEIKNSVKTAVNPDNNLVSLTVRAGSAKEASDLANAFATETKRVLTDSERGRMRRTAKDLERSVKDEPDGSIAKVSALQSAARLRSIATLARPVEITSPATEPSGPVTPKPVRDGILALFLGLVFGTLLAFLRDSLDRRLTDPHDVQRQLQIPMVGYVEADSLGGIGFSRNGSARESQHGLEPFRILRSNTEFLAGDRPLRTLAVTSPVAEEGKSSVAAGLATAVALAGKRVLLVECDLRRPVFADRFDIAEAPGLSDWATGSAKPPEVVQPVPIGRSNNNGQEAWREGEEGESLAPSLTVISAGTFSHNPAELLASERFAGFVEQVKEVYDLVVLDCAPLLPVGDALEVLPQADAALLCIRLNQTTREQALAAKAALEHLPERPIGLVLTGVRPGREGYYYGYYSSRPSTPAAVISPGPGQSSGVSQQ
jgi:succinoglycan biosynthesis transport protein ExoP